MNKGNTAVLYRVDYETENNENHSQRKTQVGPNHYLLWGEGSAYQLVTQDEHNSRKFERHSALVVGVTQLKYGTDKFLTIGEDMEVHICSTSGRRLHILKGHKTRILGTIELSENRLLTVGEEADVRLWDTISGENLAIISARVRSLSSIQVFAGAPYFSVLEEGKVSIWSSGGDLVTVLEGLESEIRTIMPLEGGRWLVKAHECMPRVWNASGKHLWEFPFEFDLYRGYVEIDDNQLLVHSEDGALSIWSEDGQVLHSHEQDDKLSKFFKDYFSNLKVTEAHFQSHPTVIDYPHIRNPIAGKASVFTARDEINQQNIDLQDPLRKRFWDFFCRPLFSPIKTALKDNISQSYKLLNTVEEAQEEMAELVQAYKKKSASKRSTSLVMAVIGTLSLGLNAAVNSDIEWLSSLVTAILGGDSGTLTSLFTLLTIATYIISISAFQGARKQQNMQRSKEQNLRLLNKLPSLLITHVNTIKDYRRKILKQIPVVTDVNCVSGVEIEKEIDKMISSSLEKVALDECGLDREDVIYTDNQAIVLKDWSWIQDKGRRENVRSKLNYNNEFSFWSGTKEIVFAVQFIQYIFLTQDKIDVFTAYYDFISGKCVGKEANAFYYKDVTNIAKREVEREQYSGFGGESVAATEIVLSVASGEKIRLTILNEESASALSESVKDNESLSIQERVDRLLAQKEIYMDDASYTDEERKDEIDVIESQIADLKTQSLTHDMGIIRSKADDAIRNIRAQLRQHKQYDSVGDKMNESIS